MKKQILFLVLFCVGISAHAQIGKIKINKGDIKLNKSKEKVAEKTSTTLKSNSQDYNTFFVEKYNQLDEIIKSFRGNTPDIQEIKDKTFKLDYPNTVITLKAKGKKGIDNVRLYEQFVDFGGKFALSPGDLNRGVRFDKNILEIADDILSQASKKRNEKLIPEAVKLLKSGKLHTEMLLAIAPEHTEAKEMDNAFQKLLDETAKDYEAYTNKLFTGNIHKQNVGKILFSKQPIMAGKETANQFVTSFDAKDKIYAIAYLEGTIEDIGNLKNYSYKQNGSYSIHFDGKQSNINITFLPESREQAYLLIEIIPDPNQAFSPTDAIDWHRQLSNLSPKKHTLKLWLWASGKQIAESSEIALDWSGADINALKTNAEQASLKAENNYAKVRSLPKKFSQPVEKFKDPQLSNANIIKLFMAQEKNCAQVLKVQTDIWENYNGGAEWEIRKNDLDIPTIKAVNGSIGLIFKGKDGYCYFVDRLYFFQTYIGGGKYAPVALGNDYSKPQKIACEKVK
ncbi:MAG: hypothetical protein MUC49_20035 [Raineya sp.]|nr:hypothetical protein [Raineya sp.]